MDIGIAFPSYIDAWREVQAAEEAGFTHAWFFDSQLIYSDVYATMALAAQHTSQIQLGTLVAIPTNRIAPVTASAIATINKVGPGDFGYGNRVHRPQHHGIELGSREHVQRVHATGGRIVAGRRRPVP